MSTTQLHYFGDIHSMLQRRSSSISRRKSMTSTVRNSTSMQGGIPVSSFSNEKTTSTLRPKPYAIRRNFRVNPVESTETTREPHLLEPAVHPMEPGAHSLEPKPHSREPGAHPMERAGKLPPIPGSRRNKERSISSSIDDRF